MNEISVPESEYTVSLGGIVEVDLRLTDGEAVVLILDVRSRDIDASGATNIESIGVVATV